jgi:hypothetical protein
MIDYATEAEIASYTDMNTSFEANKSACDGFNQFQTFLTQLQLVLVLYYNTCDDNLKIMEHPQ